MDCVTPIFSKLIWRSTVDINFIRVLNLILIKKFTVVF